MLTNGPPPDALEDDPSPGKEIFTFADRIDLVNLVNDRLYLMAITDPLTGVKNRRSFLDSLEKALERTDRSRQPLSVLIADADHFKSVNDTHGHHAGDSVLQMLAQAFAEEVGDARRVGRLGGEEFAVQLPDVALADALKLCERLLARIRDTRIDVGPEMIGCTISIGLTAAAPGDTVASLLRRSDLALYRAKQNGRDRVEVA